MVKNKKGGSGHKRMARKHVSGPNFNNKLRKKKEEDEIYARVIKLNGGQFAHIMCSDGVKRNLVIRAKFRRRRRGNQIAADTLVLAGVRSWEVTNNKKLEKADLLEVYTSSEADALQKSGELPICLKAAGGNEDEVDDDAFVFDKNATKNDFIQNVKIKATMSKVSEVEKRGDDRDIGGLPDDFDWDDI